MEIKQESAGCGTHCGTCTNKATKLDVFDWLKDIEDSHADTDLVEVQFKNTRKGYFRNTNDLRLEKGDIVAVEATPGHDIGTVTLTGRLVLIQMKKHNQKFDNPEIKRVYRKARPIDMEKYEEARAKEQDTMIRSRKLAEDLKLNMKIGDVEYQGDGNKAIFYYIADERVDFRQLIRVLADTFKIRIEMKQIGARQEAGRIGGIGPCGRELCCSSWMSNFESVSTSAARHQDISLNPQKLAGQCGKLKCCLNHEVDSYVEAQRKLPPKEVPLETKDGTFYHFKTDVFNQLMTYSSERNFLANLTVLHADRVIEIQAMNKRGQRPENLLVEIKKDAPAPSFQDGVGEESLTRFDREKKNKSFKPRPNTDNRNRENSAPRPNNDNRPRENRDNRDNRGPRPVNNNNTQSNAPRENRPSNPNQGQNNAPRFEKPKINPNPNPTSDN
ncbi:MAG: regulatory iron-sulfur-containing complex subunit RicT [Bacteroidales bacterium]|nr:regulatory iron-sulfur-containing complex subunit RicT [Bacteroidales bacterium]